MSGRVVAAFCFGALSYHVVQSVAFAPLEVAEGLNLSVETLTAGQRSLSSAFFEEDVSEVSTNLNGDHPRGSAVGVEASKSWGLIDKSSIEASIIDASEDSLPFDALKVRAFSHIGAVLSADSADQTNPITTHLTPIEPAIQARVGSQNGDVDKTPAKEHRIEHIGDRLTSDMDTFE
jgi:hypothetical protein